MSAAEQNRKLKVALVQMRTGEDPAVNLARALDFTRQAIEAGAKLVCLPEVFRSRYFCQTETGDHFALAEPIPNQIPIMSLGLLDMKNYLIITFIDKYGIIEQVWSYTGAIDPLTEKWNNKVELFFIDASHTFENCYNDSKIAYEIIKQYGIIIWHDYSGWEGVTKALDLIYDKNNKSKIIYINMYHIKDTSLAVGVVINKG